MRIADSLAEKLLKQHGLTEEQLVGLREQEVREKKPLQDLAIKNNLVSEKDLTKLYGAEIEVPLVELNAREIKKETLHILPERIARQYHAVVFDIDPNGTKLIAMEDPDDIQALNFLQKQLGNDLRVYIVTSSLMQAALDQYRENVGSELTKVISSEEDIEEEVNVDESDLAEDSPIAQTVNLLIEYGVKSGASDIHIEPREDYVVTRYRIDGLLREANKLPKKVLNALVSRIKILSNLKIDERRAPQDGRFKVQVGGGMYALRVSTLPIVDGEKVVMRILNEGSKAADFNELGFWGIARETLEHAIVQPHGMILVTGPTGSGKSTTLFSVLSKLNTPNVNISTVEDPVEYRIPGVNQTQVNPLAGMTFTNGLRALLRQDPNIIMVGEIRDGETAGLGVQAALTGHLVFSTLHTNNAATCLPRLLEMKIEPFLIASTVRVVIGQRLVRRLCAHCRESYQPEIIQLKQLTKTFRLDCNGLQAQIHQLEVQALEDGIGISNLANAAIVTKARANTSDTTNASSGGSKDSKETKGVKNATNPKDDRSVDELSTSTTAIIRLWRSHPDGCVTCNHTGYKGRIGIYEVLNNSQVVQSLIVANATSDIIQAAAIKDGMLTMQIDGLVKALRGETTIEEILRVTSDA